MLDTEISECEDEKKHPLKRTVHALIPSDTMRKAVQQVLQRTIVQQTGAPSRAKV